MRPSFSCILMPLASDLKYRICVIQLIQMDKRKDGMPNSLFYYVNKIDLQRPANFVQYSTAMWLQICAVASHNRTFIIRFCAVWATVLFCSDSVHCGPPASISFPITPQIIYLSRNVFSRVHATLHPALSIRPLVGWSVTLLSFLSILFL